MGFLEEQKSRLAAEAARKQEMEGLAAQAAAQVAAEQQARQNYLESLAYDQARKGIRQAPNPFLGEQGVDYDKLANLLQRDFDTVRAYEDRIDPVQAEAWRKSDRALEGLAQRYAR